MLVWFGFWAVQTGEQTVLMFRITSEVRLERLDRTLARNDADLARYQSTATTQPEGLVKNLQFQRDRTAEQRQEMLPTLQKLQLAHRILLITSNFIPKTGQTIDLLRRSLVSAAALPNEGGEEADNGRRHGPMADPEVQRRLRHSLDARSPSWIIGTSLGFEAVVLVLAAWIFCRRDY